MLRLSYIALAAATLLIAVLAFAVGRSSRGFIEDSRSIASDIRDGAGHLPSSEMSGSKADDLAKATIENIGQVEFDRGYRLLRAASPKTLAQWTARLEAMPTSPRKTAGIASFFRILAQVDTKTAVELALKLRGREARAVASTALAGATPEANVTELTHLIAESGPNVLGNEWGELIVRWSMTDPVSAANFAAKHLGAKTDSYWLGSMLENWAAVDPGAAQTWLEKLAPEQRDATALAGFYSGWFERDRPAAVDHLVAHGSIATLTNALATVGPAIFKESPEAARALISKFPEAERQKAVVGSVAQAAGGSSASREANYNHESVTKWLVTLPADVAEDSLGQTMAGWSNSSPEAAAAWMKGLPTELHDRVAASVCRAVNWSEPQRNLTAGYEITDPNLREATLRSVIKQFASRKLAREFVSTANLPPAQASELERMIAER